MAKSNTVFDDVFNEETAPADTGFSVSIPMSAEEWDALERKLYEPNVPEGRFTARVTGFVNGKSKAGEPMFTWTFTLSDGEAAGKSVTHYTTLKTGMWQPVFKALDITPQSTPEFFEGGRLNIAPSDIIGRTCIIETAWKKTVKDESKHIPEDERQPQDYWTNVRIKSFAQAENSLI